MKIFFRPFFAIFLFVQIVFVYHPHHVLAQTEPVYAPHTNEDVIFTEPNSKVYAVSVTPNDTLYELNQYYLPQIHAPEAWEFSTGSREVVVAVLDSGVDLRHEDLKRNIWVNMDEIRG